MDKRDHKSRRGMFGLLLAGWLSLGLQPCLVAAAEHACPHCPPETADDMPAHHEGHAHHAGADEGDSAPTCASMQSDCCDAESALVAKRIGSDKPDSPDSPVSVTAADPASLLRPLAASVPKPPPEPRARPAPIHVLNCVYLK